MEELRKIPFREFKEHELIDFGTVSLSEQDIIAFAKLYDPLDFHIDVEAAKKSFFKGLIASVPHLFNLYYQRNFLPHFKDTIVCGLEVNNWKFIKPVYANSPIQCIVEILEIKPNYDKGVAVVKWGFNFLDDKKESVQTLEMTILHKI
jgi:acyl dehydratase